jgi:hypothetical protein
VRLIGTVLVRWSKTNGQEKSKLVPALAQAKIKSRTVELNSKIQPCTHAQPSEQERQKQEHHEDFTQNYSITRDMAQIQLMQIGRTNITKQD